MHEAVRRYFIKLIDENELKEFHALAAEYYQIIYNQQKTVNQKDPEIICELIHHLTYCGKYENTKDLQLIVIDEIKPNARKIYQEQRDYKRALDLYRIIEKILPNDIDVLAYIGRCYARMDQWKESDDYFKKAIEISQITKKPVWWIYRDWGHIRARYLYYEEAYDLFKKAMKFKPYEPSIMSVLAYINWKQGNDDEAYELYEMAYEINKNHSYTLLYFSKFLESIGEYQRADDIRQKLNELESEYKYNQPAEYDIELEYDE